MPSDSTALFCLRGETAWQTSAERVEDRQGGFVVVELWLPLAGPLSALETICEEGNFHAIRALHRQRRQDPDFDALVDRCGHAIDAVELNETLPRSELLDILGTDAFGSARLGYWLERDHMIFCHHSLARSPEAAFNNVDFWLACAQGAIAERCSETAIRIGEPLPFRDSAPASAGRPRQELLSSAAGRAPDPEAFRRQARAFAAEAERLLIDQASAPAAAPRRFGI